MEVKKVSAFRDKRGLHPVSDARSQVGGFTAQGMDERETDGMKTYILRGLKGVEGEKSMRPSRPACLDFRRPFRTEFILLHYQTLRVWLMSGCAFSTRGKAKAKDT